MVQQPLFEGARSDTNQPMPRHSCLIPPLMARYSCFLPPRYSETRHSELIMRIHSASPTTATKAGRRTPGWISYSLIFGLLGRP